jgi:hypothetical protein
MTDKQINSAIAEACGWRKEDGVYMWTANGIDWTSPDLRDYCNDLNAMHEAQAKLNEHEFVDYIWNIMHVCHEPMQSTSRQRAEAFLRTLGKWEETK